MAVQLGRVWLWGWELWRIPRTTTDWVLHHQVAGWPADHIFSGCSSSAADTKRYLMFSVTSLLSTALR